MDRYTCILAVLTAAVGLAACASVPEPVYTVLEIREGYELRRYNGYIVAETEVSGTFKDSISKGFRALFDYINGANTAQYKMKMTAPVIQQSASSSEKLLMTAPVIQRAKDKSYAISFVMPKGYTLDTLPKPDNPAITLREVSARKTAVLRFSWYATEDRVRDKEHELGKLLEKDGIKTVSDFYLALYDPPWTPPFMRRNEVMVDVE